ncbi:MAG: hypothetical protein JEZ09_02625 [Salinivirgaceae bacterium]|nr:hypothetical protein [Salinivirgaceae bacterium]
MLKKLPSILKRISNKQALLVFFLLSFIIYGNTLVNDYALDDSIVITKNEFTKKGISGITDIFTSESFTGFFGRQKELVAGGRYRPLSMATFAIEYEFFGLNPFISHFINIILYALLCWILFQILFTLLKQKLEFDKAKIIACIAVLLFLIHPIHTEVVANIKGRDEILSLLFSLVAFYFIIKPLSNKIINFCVVLISFFVALLSKENAIAFVFIIPAALWYFNKSNFKHIAYSLGVLILPTLVFLIIRNSVLGGFNATPSSELMNNPFLGLEGNEKYATILFTLLIYFKLLIFPHPLTFDYYPFHIPVVDFSNEFVWLSVGLVLMLFISFISGLRRGRSVISFSIIGFAASFVLMSNLFFSVGTFMNERFVFVASVFWCLGIVYLGFLIIEKREKLKPIVLIVGLYMLIFYPTKTIARNMAWKNDFTLFTTDVKTSVNSAKSNCSAGGKLWEEGKITKAQNLQKEYYQLSEYYLRKAVQIHPTYTDAWVLLGNVLYDSKKEALESAKCYLNVLRRNPTHENARKNFDIVMQQEKDKKLQLQYYLELWKLDSMDYTLNYRLGVIEGRYLGNLPNGIHYLERAVKIAPNKTEALKDLGTAYGMSHQIEKAYNVFKRAVKIDPNDDQMFYNLAVSCMQLGLEDEAKENFTKAAHLKASKQNN